MLVADKRIGRAVTTRRAVDAERRCVRCAAAVGRRPASMPPHQR